MKTRNDFVSNSSSCSFILSAAAGLADAVKFFAETFGGDPIPFKMSNEESLECYVKNKWRAEVKSKLRRDEDYSERQDPYYVSFRPKPDPEEVSWDSIPMDFDDFIALASDRQTLGKIDRVQFRCEDTNFTGIFFLRLLYAFFERNELCPDCSDTEQAFIRTGSDDEKFIMKLASVCGGGKTKTVSKGKKP